MFLGLGAQTALIRHWWSIEHRMTWSQRLIIILGIETYLSVSSCNTLHEPHSTLTKYANLRMESVMADSTTGYCCAGIPLQDSRSWTTDNRPRFLNTRPTSQPYPPSYIFVACIPQQYCGQRRSYSGVYDCCLRRRDAVVSQVFEGNWRNNFTGSSETTVRIYQTIHSHIPIKSLHKHNDRWSFYQVSSPRIVTSKFRCGKNKKGQSKH